MNTPNQDIPDTREELMPNSKESNKEEKQYLQKPSATTTDIPEFGWSNYAERVNGRFAMIGFSAIFIIELLSRETFLKWAGIIN